MTFTLLWLAFCLNPHLMTRAFAAKSNSSLKFAYAVSSFAPFLSHVPGILLGMAAAALESDEEADEVFGVMLDRIGQISPTADFVVTLILIGSLAAIVSTADSAVLALSNVVTIDMVQRHRPHISEKRVLLIGRCSGVAAVALCILIFGASGSTDLSAISAVQNALLVSWVRLCCFESTALIC
jgi:SSS family solute:Na+ symporter/sodium/pantothenate symporter